MTPGRLLKTLSFTLILLFSLTISVFPAHAAEFAAPTPEFSNFLNSVKDGQTGVVRGVYVPGLFALKIIQQPAQDPTFVSSLPDVVTDFKAAKAAGNLGLLAHNYLAGQDFPALTTGQEIRIVFGDGKIEYFRVTKILRYQALQPKSTTSDFVNLESSEKLSATQLFEKVYKGSHHLTFQTCIYKDGEQSWGRLFVIAEPYTP
jgi:hypothetical protein